MGDSNFYDVNRELKEKADESTASDDNLIQKSSSSSKNPKRQCCGSWTLAFTMATCFLISLLTWKSDVLLQAISPLLVIRNGSRLYQVWAQEPVTATFSVFLFNYTNTERFESGEDSKLNLQEIGPYSFTVSTSKENIIFHENGTVSFQERKIYHFSPELSRGSVSDVVITPSIPFMSSLNHFRDSYALTRWFVGKAMSTVNTSTPFISITVDELMWGYNDPLYDIAVHVIKFQGTGEELPFKRFGLFAGKNGTQPDVVTIFTGETDIRKKGLISRFNGEMALSHWGSPSCNSLEAYPGSALPPYLNRDPIYLYNKDVCRRIPVTYRYTSMVRGIKTSRYELPEDMYASGRSEECYCMDRCLPDGVLDVSACAFGGPIIASKPHFLDGSPVLTEKLDGLRPDRNKHSVIADIEPNLGFVMAGTSTAQLNVMVRNQMGANINTAYTDRLILPVTWVSVTMDEMPSALMWEVRGIVISFMLAQICIYFGPLITICVCFIIIFCRYYKRRNSKETQSKISSSFNSTVITDSVA